MRACAPCCACFDARMLPAPVCLCSLMAHAQWHAHRDRVCFNVLICCLLALLPCLLCRRRQTPGSLVGACFVVAPCHLLCCSVRLAVPQAPDARLACGRLQGLAAAAGCGSGRTVHPGVRTRCDVLFCLSKGAQSSGRW